MKRIISAVVISALALGLAGAQPAGFLQAKDSRIVDGQGREVQLRGMGLGGWMLQEGYMLALTDYWNRGGAKPSREIAVQALSALADSILAANCRFNSNVVQALIQQNPQTPPSTR